LCGILRKCRGVVDSTADLVEQIFTRSVTVRILATSREGLGVADERLWRVPSPDAGAAVELFIERASSTAPGPVEEEVTAVEEICRRLDGYSVGHRVGGLPHVVDVCQRGA
jgi:predicted ATPase